MTAELTNPSLAELGFLIGEWDLALSGASFLPDPDEVVHGRVDFSAIEDGRILVMRQGVESSGPPAASWVMGRDDSKGEYTVLYADGRGVFRIYEMTLTEDSWRLWRNDPEFSQRFEATIGPDRASIEGRWEKRQAGGVWEHDFDVTYSRR
ncbi:MAG TPA: hypothetical protein VN799_04285 [Acidimicrobiales bacterium]|nr:hypothetical protein [Acidimicrobiales bacterium]